MGEDIGKIFEKMKDIGKGFLLENIVKRLEDIHLSLIEMRREARFLERQDLIDEIMRWSARSCCCETCLKMRRCQ